MKNRVAESLSRTIAKLRGLSPEQRAKLDKDLVTDFRDLVEYQKLQASAFASGRLTADEAGMLYRIYGGEAPSAEKWGRLTLAEKIVGTKVASELLDALVKSQGRNPRFLTYAQEMKKKFGVPFDPSRVKSVRGFRYGDRVVQSSPLEHFQSGIPVGSVGTVDAIAGFKGHSVSPDPMGKMLFVKWDRYGQRSVWLTSVRKLPRPVKNVHDGIHLFGNRTVTCRACGAENPVSAINSYQRCGKCGTRLLNIIVRRK